ncbi:hypothetical protein [Marinobacter fonticola]|uniref:hypothetical protein n=1 Tax=Marinobacter fonticola TaxID=2603215 RepID=UPI00193115E9|nr:hypothetical protein [Marinobacter fonticola]
MSCCDKKSCDDKGKVNSEAGPGGLMGLLTGPRRWWLFGAIGVTAGLTFGWEQLVLFGIAPILIGLLPCLVMCGLGLCMMKCKDKSGSAKASVAPLESTDGTDPVAPQRPISNVADSTRSA